MEKKTEKLKDELQKEFCRRFVNLGDKDIRNCINNPNPNPYFDRILCSSCERIDEIFSDIGEN